jgi:hypothetical protein
MEALRKSLSDKKKAGPVEKPAKRKKSRGKAA